MKHTPGPWNVEPTLRQLIVSDRGAIAEPWMHDTIGAIESSANARLIAAAPDLLNALQIMVNAVVPNADPLILFASIEKARAAIGKATGGKE